MDGKKTTVNLTAENLQKINNLIKETGRSQTDLVNQAISEIPIVVLGNQKSIATCFFDLRKAVNSKNEPEIHKEVELACQSLNSLMEKIEEMTHSKGE